MHDADRPSGGLHERATRQGPRRRRSMAGTSCSRVAPETGCVTMKRSARPCAPICRGSSPAPTSSTMARAPCGFPCACSSIIASACCRPARPRRRTRQGEARRRSRTCQSAKRPGTKRRRRQGSGRHRAHARIQGRRCDRLALGRHEAAQSAAPGGRDRGLRVEARGLGPPWRALASRSAALAQGIGEAPRPRRGLARIHRRGPALSTAHAAPPTGAARGGILSDRRIGQHVGPRPATREDLFLLGGGRSAAPIQGARHRVRGRIPRTPGSSAKRISSRSPAAAAPWPRSGWPRSARSCSSASIPAAATYTCFMPRTATTPPMTAPPRPPSSRRSPRPRATPGYVEISAGVRSSQSETMALFETAAAEGRPCGRFSVGGPDDIAGAVRHFFTAEANTSGSGDAAGSAP